MVSLKWNGFNVWKKPSQDFELDSSWLFLLLHQFLFLGLTYKNYFPSASQVDDQMKLLQNSWSDMLVLDHLHQRLHNGLPDDTTLHNGQKFDLLGLGLLGVPSLADKFAEIQNKLQELKFDVGDYICMKFLLLLNPGKYYLCLMSPREYWKN